MALMNTSTSTPKIELIFDQDCPNVPQAREALQQALKQLQLEPSWQEWQRSDPACPDYARSLGSPSILVNERDVSAAVNNDSSCCRVYPENAGFKGCPSVDSIIAAIKSI